MMKTPNAFRGLSGGHALPLGAVRRPEPALPPCEASAPATSIFAPAQTSVPTPAPIAAVKKSL